MLDFSKKAIPINYLQAFEAAGRFGSFRLASGELGISPSAVSHAIRRLEDIVGCDLFEREGRSVRLNSTGLVLFQHINRGFQEVRHGFEVLGSRGPNVMKIHCAPSLAAQWLAPRLPRIIDDIPGIEIRMSANFDIPDYQRDEFDVDFCYGVPPSGDVVYYSLGIETVCPVCTRDIACQVRTPHDVMRFPLIESELKRVNWLHWFEANGMSPDKSSGYRFDRSFISIAAAVNGIGIALESTRLVERELANGLLVAPLAGKATDLEYLAHYMAIPKHSRQRSHVKTFIDWIMNELNLSARHGD